MVGEATTLVDRLAHRRGGHARAGNLVVDAPAHVLRVSLPAVGPPRVMARLTVQAPKHIDEADLVEDMREPGALLGREARVLPVRAPVREVDLLLGDVPVPAQDDFLLAAAQQLQMPCEVFEEPQLGSLPVRAGRARRHVDRDDPEVAEARLDIASFGIELAIPEADQDLIGRPATVDRDAAIALLLRKRMAALV